MDYIKKTLLTTLTLFIAGESSLNAGWKDLFTMPRVALGIAVIAVGGMASSFLYAKKLHQKINTLEEQQQIIINNQRKLQIIINNPGEKLEVRLPANRDAMKNLDDAFALMATKKDLVDYFNFFTLTMQQSQQEIETIHNDLSRGVEQSSSYTQWTDDDKEPITVIIKSDTFKKTLDNLEKLATTLNPKDSLRKHAQGVGLEQLE